MKWISHQIVTSVIVYTATDNLLYMAYSMIGTVMPDKLEGDPRSASDYWTWRSAHRGWSHWPVPYLFLMLMIFVVEERGLAVDGFEEMGKVGIFLMLGALLHIFEDALCGKVPLIHLNEKIGIKLFEVGSFGEYFFSMAFIIAIWGGRLIALRL